MISGIFISDTQGEILIERTYTTEPIREIIKKVIHSQFTLTEEVINPTIENEMVWEMDGWNIFAVRRGRVLFSAMTKEDTFIPEPYEILSKIQEVFEAAFVEINIENIKLNSNEILIVFFLN